MRLIVRVVKVKEKENPRNCHGFFYNASLYNGTLKEHLLQGQL